MSDKSIQVVAGIIWNKDKTALLITQRPRHLHKGGFWEFPGGKVEARESKEKALARELCEELSLKFSSQEYFQSVQFDYPEKSVTIDFFDVFDLLTEPEAQENQTMRWISVSELDRYQFPEANQPIIDVLLKGRHG